LIVTPSTRRMVHDMEKETPEAPLDGTATLPGRRLIGRIHEAVAPWTKGQATHEPVVRRLLMTASHLIEREASEAYRAAVASVPAGPDLRVLVVGPRAPYSFCAVSGNGLGTHGMNLAD
ncbi:MAG TPA: GvpL/GvpF family gas vesicle protein, partial [Chloroflexota bacterium]|nr:GvpL/GvpF family gas vesicle protein [Chloroflexota bacterium]